MFTSLMIGLLTWGQSCAGAVDAASAVQCVVHSARLNFGRLSSQRPSPVAAEGEVMASCLNHSSEMQRVTLSLLLPSLGLQAALLRAGLAFVPVTFYRDAQWTDRWGTERNGFAGLAVALELTAGEHRLMRLPVYALLDKPRVAPAGVYLMQLPLTLTTEPR